MKNTLFTGAVLALLMAGCSHHHDESVASEEAHQEASPHTIVVTPEQARKMGITTDVPQQEHLGIVIRTTAVAETTRGEETVLTAHAPGMVSLSNPGLVAGMKVSRGEVLLHISDKALAGDNIQARILEAQGRLEEARAAYERTRELVQLQIIPGKELLPAQNRYEQAQSALDNLKTSFSSSGQSVRSPKDGYVKNVLVSHGSYVATGDPLVEVTQNKTLTLRAGVRAVYARELDHIYSAVISTQNPSETFTLEELNGTILPPGQAVQTSDNLIPVHILIDHTGRFLPGTVVSLALKTKSDTPVLTIPNTSLMEEQGMHYVFLKTGPETFEKRPVTTGHTDGLRTIVLDGIDLGDTLVTQGAIWVKLAQNQTTLDPHSGHVH